MSGFSRFRGRRPWRWCSPKNCGAFRGASPVIVVPPVMLLLAGCSLAPVIAESTLDYNTTVETVTNGVLVTNILRARDGAPLYFSDLSQIRGAVQLSLQAQTTVPYGPMFPAGAGASAQAGPLTVSSQPGFDVAPLNTKKFAERHAGRHRRKSLCVFHSTARRCQGASQPRRQPRRALPTSPTRLLLVPARRNSKRMALHAWLS